MKKDFCRILGVSTSSFFYICSRSLLINTRLFFISHFVSVPLRRGYRRSRITVFVCSFVPVSFCIFDYLYRDFWFFVDCFVTSALSRSSHLEVFVKKVFLEISENSQENTCVRVSFLINLQALGFFQRTPLVAASARKNPMKKKPKKYKRRGSISRISIYILNSFA